jgi:hypothetical protein
MRAFIPDERKSAALGPCPGPYSWCFEGLKAYEAGGNAVIFCGPAHFERRD